MEISVTCNRCQLGFVFPDVSVLHDPERGDFTVLNFPVHNCDEMAKLLEGLKEGQ